MINDALNDCEYTTGVQFAIKRPRHVVPYPTTVSPGDLLLDREFNCSSYSWQQRRG